MHRHVEVLIGRITTDPELRLRFATEPRAVIREQHLELTEVELAALVATDPAAFDALAAALDARLRKASVPVEGLPSGEMDSRSATDPKEDPR